MKRKNLYQKCIGMGLAAVLALGTLAGCGNKAVETDASVEESTAATEESLESTESTAQAETVETAQTESTQTVESTAEEVNYAEEQGRESNHLMQLCMYALTYWSDSDGNYTENGPAGAELYPTMATYYIEQITVSEPDEDGNVIYTIPYTVDFAFSAENPNNDTLYFGYRVEDIGLMDSYTGTVFPRRELSGDGSYDAYIDIVWDDITYSIGYTESAEWSYGDWQRYEAYVTIDEKLLTKFDEITVTAPADYDGLVLFINNNGVTEYEELDTEIGDAQSFEDMMSEDGTTDDDYTFIRVSDYVTK